MSRSKSHRVHWTSTASNDLRVIIRRIAADRPKVAKTLFRELKKRAYSLKAMSSRGRVVPELQEYGVTLYQELVWSPWRMIYHVKDQIVYIVSLIDSRRNLEDLLLDRFIRNPKQLH